MPNPYLIDENHTEVKDNNDKYFDDGELKELESNEFKVQKMGNKCIKWMSLNHYLGSGSFGSVELGQDIESGKFIAVKQLSIKGFNPKQIQAKIDQFEQEIRVLSKLDHPNIVKYLGMEQTQSHINLFLEHVTGGSIKSLLERYGKFPENLVQIYTKQILTGIEYLHKHGIIHRDIKGANILVDANGICKLADFGSSKRLSFAKEECKTFTGTPNWMAPEVINGKGHGRFADIWSLGCTIIEMVTGKPPWSDETKNQYQIIMEIMKGQPPTIPSDLSPQTKEFLSHCFYNLFLLISDKKQYIWIIILFIIIKKQNKIRILQQNQKYKYLLKIDPSKTKLSVVIKKQKYNRQEPHKRWNVIKLLNHSFIPSYGNTTFSVDISNMFKPLQKQIN